MDRIQLIELIEVQTELLSDGGRVLWEELEFLRESIPDPEEPGRMALEYDLMERIFGLPAPQQFIVSRLILASWVRPDHSSTKGVRSTRGTVAYAPPAGGKMPSQTSNLTASSDSA